MKSSRTVMDRRKWLLRLIVVRVIVFSVFVGAEPSVDMLVLLAAVYALSVCWFALLKLNERWTWQAYAQIGVDLLLITWMVNRTGGVDSYFSSLYFLEIVMSSILLERRGAFVTATASSLLHSAHLDLAYFGVLPSTAGTWPSLTSLQYIVGISIFGFCAVGFLSNHLAESWRRTGAELEKSTGQVAFLQAFNDRIIDSLGSGLATTDLEGNIYLFNRAAQEMTGHDTATTFRRPISTIFRALPGKIQPGQFEIVALRRNGEEIYLRFSVYPLMIDEKNTAGYVWCFDDLSDMKALERQMRQKERMAALGAMSAGIAHEIRNPLASIIGSFNLLKSDLKLNAEHQQLVEIISRESERLNTTINHFLSYARPPAPKPQSIALEGLISETVRLLRNSPELKPDHRIETILQPVVASVDEGMMRQVLYNLTSNAFKAMPDGGTLTIRLERRDGGARIQFEDTGIGLTEQEIDQLFVPFNSSFRTGTGLGLPIVYQIVNAHNGAISVSSRKGVGTTFLIDL